MPGIGYGYYGFDIYYLILIIPALIISLVAQIRVKTVFNRYSRLETRGMSGADAAQEILRRNGVVGVRIEKTSGSLTDHFDPTTNVISLSESVYDKCTVAAVGVAAHEAGHAVQYSEEYAPVKLRGAVIKISRVGSYLSWPLLILGLLFSFRPLFFAGICCFLAVVLFELITLPVEYDASKRAMAGLTECGVMDQEQLSGAKKVLGAAAMTYLAALIMSVAQLLRLILLFRGRRD